jgi:hypothetical protein
MPKSTSPAATRAQHVLDGAVGQAHLHARVLSAVGRNHIGQQRAGHQLRRGDAHHALAQGLEIVDAGQRTIQVLQGFFHQRHKAAAYLGEADAAGVAVHQAHAQCRLQFLDQAAERRLRHVQRTRRLGKTARAGQRHEGAQLAQADIHWMIL